MSTLSDIDIEKEILKNKICIFPFNKKNMKGASYNLTASQFAYKIPDTDGGSCERVYDPLSNKVKLPQKSTVLMATNEVIWVSKDVSGTYHSKVKLVSKGVGHIGTTLDPEYLGVSIIAIHNHSQRDIFLTAGEDTFASLVFSYVRSKSAAEHDNRPGRPDLIANISPVREDIEWLEQDFRSNLSLLKEKMKLEKDFIDLKARYARNSEWWKSLSPYFICIFIAILGAILNGILERNKSSLQSQNWWYDPAVLVSEQFPTAAVAGFIGFLLSDIRRKN